MHPGERRDRADRDDSQAARPGAANDPARRCHDGRLVQSRQSPDLRQRRQRLRRHASCRGIDRPLPEKPPRSRRDRAVRSNRHHLRRQRFRLRLDLRPPSRRPRQPRRRPDRLLHQRQQPQRNPRPRSRQKPKSNHRRLPGKRRRQSQTVLRHPAHHPRPDVKPNSGRA